jgi:hypothetical protein
VGSLVAEIEVRRADVEQFLSRFHVRVTDDGGSAEFVVTLSGTDFERLGGNHRSPEAFVKACFVFLLERESKDEILSVFDVSQIRGFFPEFELAIGRPTETGMPKG